MKGKRELEWGSTIRFDELVKVMVEACLKTKNALQVRRTFPGFVRRGYERG